MLRQQDISNPTSRNETNEFTDYNNASQGGIAGTQDFTYNDANFTGVEDLGQFWLWDLDNMNF